MKEKLIVNAAVLGAVLKGAALGRLRTADYRVSSHSTASSANQELILRLGKYRLPWRLTQTHHHSGHWFHQDAGVIREGDAWQCSRN